MTESRHKTTLEVRAETRGIKEVGKELDRAFDPDRLERLDSILKGFSGNVEHLTTSLKDMVKALTSLPAQSGAAGTAAGALGGAAGAAAGAAGGSGRRPPAPPAAPPRTPSWAERNPRAAGALSYGQGVGQSVASGSGAAETALAGIPFVGGILAGAMGSARRYVHMADALSATQAGNYANTGRSLSGFGRTGESLGLDYSASSSLMAGIGESTGLRGDQLSDEIVAGLAAYQRIGGVDAGGLVGSIHAGSYGATDDPMQVVAETISTAIDSGFREGKIGEYVQQIASWTEQARREGINLNPSSANAFTRGFAGLGLTSEAAAATGQSAASALRSAGGDNSIRSRVVMNIAMGEMGMSYARARAATEGNMAPEIMQRSLERFWQMSGGNVDLMAQLLVDEGLAPSMSAAIQIAESFAGGGDGSGASAAAGFSQDGSTVSAQGFMANRTEGYGGVSGGAVYRAGRTNIETRAGQNGDVQGAVRAVEDAELRMTVSLVTGLSEAVTKLTELAKTALVFIQNGDWAGLGSWLGGMVSGSVGEVVQEAGQRAGQFGRDTAQRGRERQRAGAAEGGVGGLLQQGAGMLEEATGEAINLVMPEQVGDQAALHLDAAAMSTAAAAAALRRQGGIPESNAGLSYV